MMPQEEINKTQTKKKQKSLFWISSTLYLTTAFSGGISAIIFVAIGGIVFAGFPDPIRLPIVWLLWLAGFLLGLRIGVNYVCNRTFVEKADIFKISCMVTTIPIVVYGILRFLRGARFQLWDIMIVIISVIIFYTAKYFLDKKATNVENIE